MAFDRKSGVNYRERERERERERPLHIILKALNELSPIT